MHNSLTLGDIVIPEKLIELFNQHPSFNRHLFEKCIRKDKRNIDMVICLLTFASDEQVDVISEHFCKAVHAPIMDGRKFRIVVCSLLNAAAEMAVKYFPEDDPNSDVLPGSCTHNLIVGSLIGKLSIQGIKLDPNALKNRK